MEARASPLHNYDHGQHHGHGPGHSHAHGHAPKDFGRSFALGIALNIGFVVVEAGFGFVTGSVALLADAGHNMSDVLGLAIAWGGATLARKATSKRFTYGLRGTTILAALANALLLLVALGAIVLESVQRFGSPAAIPGPTISAVAAVGIIINLATAMLFASGRKGDINIRGAFLHMAADAAVSAGVVIAGLIIWQTRWMWVDPALSLVIAALIFWQTWGLLSESVEMSLSAVPRAIEFDAVSAALSALPGVTGTHDLHIWPMGTSETVLTAHLVMPGGHPGDTFLAGAQTMLRNQFAIGHATLQIEDDAACFCSMEAGAAPPD